MRENRGRIRVFARHAVLVLALATSTAFAETPREPAAGGAAPEEYRLPPDKRAKAEAFARAKVTRYFAATAYGLAILAGLVALRVGPRLRDAVEGVSVNPLLALLLFAPALFAAIAVLELPLAVWGHALAVRFEQSVQGWGGWLADWAKREAVGLVIATVATGIFFAIVRWSPDRWWLWFWVALQPLVVFLVFLQPLVIAPLFFDFRPLAEVNPGLVERIERVLDRAGVEIPRERMFEMNASTKLESLNAYVAGIGDSKRVVVWDTTLERLSEDETLFVFGHELGHYVLGHIPRTLALIAAVLLPAFFVLAKLVETIVARSGGALGLRGVDDLAALPLLLLVASLASFVATPLGNAYSRWQEHQSDVYGLDVVRGVIDEPGRAAAGAFQTLGEVGLADPDPSPFVRFWLYSHPPIAERIRFAIGGQ